MPGTTQKFGFFLFQTQSTRIPGERQPPITAILETSQETTLGDTVSGKDYRPTIADLGGCLNTSSAYYVLRLTDLACRHARTITNVNRI